MKNLYLLLGIAALAITLCGCPATGESGTETGGSATAKTAADTPAGTTENADAGEAAEEEISHPLLDAELELTPVEWEINGVMLGDSYDDYMLLQAEDANTNSMWIKDGVLGMLNIYNSDENPMPAESTVYQNGTLISLMRTEEMEPEDYTIELADAMSAYGDCGDTPPDWALETPLFEGGYEPEEGIDMSFWGNEEAGAMMMYGYDQEQQVCARMIVYLAHHAEVVDATIEDMNAKMEAMIAEQMDAMAAEQGEGAAGEEVPFSIEDEATDVDEEIVEAEEATEAGETPVEDGEAATE